MTRRLARSGVAQSEEAPITAPRRRRAFGGVQRADDLRGHPPERLEGACPRLVHVPLNAARERWKSHPDRAKRARATRLARVADRVRRRLFLAVAVSGALLHAGVDRAIVREPGVGAASAASGLGLVLGVVVVLAGTVFGGPRHPRSPWPGW